MIRSHIRAIDFVLSGYRSINIDLLFPRKVTHFCRRRECLTSKGNLSVYCLRPSAAFLDDKESCKGNQTTIHSKHENYMRLALEQAQKAFDMDEVPVGAVLVGPEGDVLASAHNSTEIDNDPTSHAEMLCIREAAKKNGGWRLLESTLYVTLEPCPMCAGALLQARVGSVVYGARNFLLGADGSWINMLRRPECKCNGISHDGYMEQKENNIKQSARIDEFRMHLSDTLNKIPGMEGELDSDAFINSDFNNLMTRKNSYRIESRQASYPNAAHPFHPRVEVTSGVLEPECAAIMKSFFARRRKR